MIIGICGFISSGKDTVADYLQLCHFRRESFAGTLKDSVSVVFQWDRELLDGRTKESRAWRETVDPWWAERLNMPNLTPRLVLQLWGTEVCRNNFHNDIWIASLENKLRKSTGNVVISDCRFPNEIQAIKNQGGKVIWVKRGPDPDLTNLHASETAWVGFNFDAILDNNGTIVELHAKIKNLVLELQPSTVS